MKLIEKGAEPNSLKTYRATKNATYSDIDNTLDIRKSLLKEQGHICAYCMRRISLRRTKGKSSKPKIEIEHFRSQHRYPDLTLTYKNMLGVCNGNVGKPGHLLCCDKSKSSFDKTHDLVVDPLDVKRISQIKYTNDGSIFSETNEVDKDLNKILNEPNLKKERANLYKNLKKQIKFFWAKTNRNKPKVIALIAKEIETWESKKWETKKDEAKTKIGQFEPYCATALYFLRKRHHQYSKS